MAKRLKKPSLFRGVSSIWSFSAAAGLSPSFAVLFALGLGLAACGFEPVHKFDSDTPRLRLAAFGVSGDAGEAGLARALERTIERSVTLSDDSRQRADVQLSRVTLDMQKSASGVARRLEVRHTATVTLMDGDKTLRKDFVLTQYMTRGDSGSDEINQLRALDELAVRDLSAQIIDFLAGRDAR